MAEKNVTTPPAALLLPRGGYLVSTSMGNFQVGTPPETIKDTLVLPDSVPKYFILPSKMFNWEKGINVSDMEFPIYFNYFIKKQRITVICTREQALRLTKALQEAVFGPKTFDLTEDTFEAGDDVFVPDIRGEIDYFRADHTLSKMLRFAVFKNGIVKFGSVVISNKNEAAFEIFDNGDLVASVPSVIGYKVKFDVSANPDKLFYPPRFGVTCLGPSHGFDPKDNTSGFIIWLNNNGIMVDPPVNSTEWLLKSNVNPKLIDSIILTHAHADHDAGTFQKILEEGKVTVYSTKTIIKSFLRKYSNFSGESFAFLWKLFSFHPVYIGRPFFLHGGEFEIFYSLHSIPCIAFRLRFQGKSFVYSSDHQGDPVLQETLRKNEIISRERLDQLKSFPWDSDVIYHESGIAPLHTPISFLSSLPTEYKKRIIVYHITRNDFEKAGDPYLRRAAFGIENTLVFKTEPFQYEEAYRLLDVLKRLDFLMDMPIWKIQQFFCIAQWKKYESGDYIIKEGSIGNQFFIIVSGNATVETADLVRSKRLGAFEYFGEVALLTNSVRTANIVAETEVLAITIDKPQFVNFISGTRFEKILKRLIARRSPDTWNLLAESRCFNHLSDYQKMWIESLLTEKEFAAKDVILREGEVLTGIYVIRSGLVHITKNGTTITKISRGDLIGMIHKIQRDELAEFTFTAEDGLSVYFIDKDDVAAFAAKNPGVGMKLAYAFNNFSC